MSLRKNKRGFTLIELLVVIVIIAILAAVAIPVYNGVVKKNKANANLGKASQIYDVAVTLNTAIEFGTVTIGAGGFSSTEAALNARLDANSQITDTIVAAQWLGFPTTSTGNYIEINTTTNKVIAVYVVREGVKVKWNKDGGQVA